MSGIDADLSEPALVGVTCACWHADIETNEALERLYRVEFNKVPCVSNENWGLAWFLRVSKGRLDQSGTVHMFPQGFRWSVLHGTFSSKLRAFGGCLGIERR